VIVPVILLLFATLAAAGMAYGTDASWARYQHGIDFIIAARRVQWPLAVLAIVLCLVLVGLVIAGRRRAWWLIGLGPVLALFVHRFVADPSNQFHVIEEPAFASATDASRFVKDPDWVVGVRFGEVDYAYPYAALFETPVVLQTDHDRRLAVLWSAYANRALAVQVGRDVRASDLEVVSMPANALLVYNRRNGQFINGVTGLTPKGTPPDGFKDAVPVAKATWKDWLAAHPDTKVLVPLGDLSSEVPRIPIQPTLPMPPGADEKDFTIAVVTGAGIKPVAVESRSITAVPMNLTGEDAPVLLFRDPKDNLPRAFARKVDDLRPHFRAVTERDRKRHPKAAFLDADTGAGWDRNGVMVDGPQEMRGKRLPRLVVEDGLSSRVMRYWFPGMRIVSGQ
jgi:hypothetical protein